MAGWSGCGWRHANEEPGRAPPLGQLGFLLVTRLDNVHERENLRDVGGNTFSIKKAIDKGMIEGPRIFPSGPPIGQTAGHFDFNGYNAVPRENYSLIGYPRFVRLMRCR